MPLLSPVKTEVGGICALFFALKKEGGRKGEKSVLRLTAQYFRKKKKRTVFNCAREGERKANFLNLKKNFC